MKEDLFPYYEREMTYLRNSLDDFAKVYPRIAKNLMLNTDPHVERLLHGFALLSGRVHHKIDDEFPAITESLLGVLYPHFLAPIPSMAIAQFEIGLDQTQSHTVKRNSSLFTRGDSIKQHSCQFRTCYPVTLWPIKLKEAELRPAAAFSATGDSVAVLRLKLECGGNNRFSTLYVDRLRFCLQGEPDMIYALYELLMNSVGRVSVRWPGNRKTAAEIPLPLDSIQPVGFNVDEGLLPYPARSFVGYRLLQEYFAFPAKFLFFDLANLQSVVPPDQATIMEVLVQISRFERPERLPRLIRETAVSTFQLGCTPIVNVFERLAEPIPITSTEYEYRVIPDLNTRPENMEVYSIEKVSATSTNIEKTVDYEPFYSARHRYSDSPNRPYWHMTRRNSTRDQDKGTEVYISLANLDFSRVDLEKHTLSVRTLCTNRDVPETLHLGKELRNVFLEKGGLVNSRVLTEFTPALRPRMRRSWQWRLISHLSLSHGSITSGGKESLQEILRVYDYAGDRTVNADIDGILSVAGSPTVARVASQHGITFAQGMRVDIDFDEAQFVGSGVYLFASVLERFLGLYNTINSFSQLTATSRQREGAIRHWRPRSGEQVIL